MDLAYSDEQQMLKDAVARYMRERYAAPAHGRAPEWNRQAWRDFAAMGLLGLVVPQAYGGTGGGPVETLLVMEALGAGPVLEPYLSTAVLGTHALLVAGSERQKSRLLPDVVAGERVLAFAHAEPQARYALHDVQARAEPAGGGWRLNGHKSCVLHGPSAGTCIVSARTSGSARDAQGVTLFLVEAGTPGLDVQPHELQDGTEAAQLLLRDVEVGPDAVLGQVGEGLPVVRQVADLAIAALVAEMVGCMQSLLDLTLAHLKTREQFGVPLGSFQVLQHRAVDMLVALEQARSMAMYAATQCTHPDPQVRSAAMSAAKYQVGKCARYVGHQAIQLHGGLGITAECGVSRPFLRLLVDEILLGDSQHHLTRMARHARRHRLAATG